MKIAFLSFQLLLATTLSAQRATIHIPESPAAISVSLTEPAPNDWGFNLITVRSNGHATSFHVRNPLECAPGNPGQRKTSVEWMGVKGMKLDASLCFYRAEYTADEVKHTILAFVGSPAASDPGPVLLLGFHADGTPYKVLERNELELFEFQANAQEGTARIIGEPSFSQVGEGDGGNGSKAPYATTYDPSAVYIIRPDTVAQYSLEESKVFNDQHYVWAGPTASENFAVVYNYPGRPKPFFVTAKQADALFAKLPKEKSTP